MAEAVTRQLISYSDSFAKAISGPVSCTAGQFFEYKLCYLSSLRTRNYRFLFSELARSQ